MDIDGSTGVGRCGSHSAMSIGREGSLSVFSPCISL